MDLQLRTLALGSTWLIICNKLIITIKIISVLKAMSQMCVRFWTPSLLHLPCTGIHSSFMWHCFDRVLSSVCLSLSSPGPLARLQCMAIQHLTRPLDTKFVICTLTTRWQQRLTECLVQSLVFHPRAINFFRESVPFAPGKARLTPLPDLPSSAWISQTESSLHYFVLPVRRQCRTVEECD